MELQNVFRYEDRQVRTVMIDSEPWFVAKDVCEVLEISKYRDTVARLDDDERESVLVDTPGGKQNMVAINESGLYALIMTSRKPEAKAFKRFVTHEVLPAIRKTGRYESAPQYKLPQNYVEALEALLNSEKEKIALGAQLMIAAPKAEMFDVIASANNAQAMSAVAKSFGIGRNKLFEILREQKVLRHNNEPYQEYIDRGYFRVRQVPILRSTRTENKTQTLVTARGIEFIGRVLQRVGLLEAK